MIFNFEKIGKEKISALKGVLDTKLKKEEKNEM